MDMGAAVATGVVATMAEVIMEAEASMVGAAVDSIMRVSGVAAASMVAAGSTVAAVDSTVEESFTVAAVSMAVVGSTVVVTAAEDSIVAGTEVAMAGTGNSLRFSA
jgi:hypothetical protein